MLGQWRVQSMVTVSRSYRAMGTVARKSYLCCHVILKWSSLEITVLNRCSLVFKASSRRLLDLDGIGW
ncbi:hypothetical protein F3Y22_tig00116989pilonHSYRG00024 [Hibiscus syriacus]|uniref:Uncharacterized protein n=1 Tax=Hibiscus syriacus TaxID=106335 RepID=A0A6A2WFJ5_HIBSY|nr:hypothetical protein F3Y22_tig00116989pilonHSYRG00024 [Hibiscus syriacus]